MPWGFRRPRLLLKYRSVQGCGNILKNLREDPGAIEVYGFGSW